MRGCNVIEMLYELNLRKFDTVLHNGATTITRMCYACLNSTVLSHICCVLFLIIIIIYNYLIYNY